MAYYLLEYDNAKRTFQKVMNGNSVPNRLRCDRGRSGRALLHPLAAEGCFVDGGRANVRIMYMATSCKQLDAGSTHLVSPVIYVAAEAPNNDIKTLYDWTRAPNRASSVTGTIPAPGQPTTPVCEGNFRARTPSGHASSTHGAVRRGRRGVQSPPARPTQCRG